MLINMSEHIFDTSQTFRKQCFEYLKTLKRLHYILFMNSTAISNQQNNINNTQKEVLF